MLDLEMLADKKRFKWLNEEEIDYLEKHFPWAETRQEAVFCLREKITEKPKCQYEGCEEFAKFNPKGYTKGCSTSHNTKLTNLEKYGVANVKQHKDIIDKAKKTYSSKSEEEKLEIQKRKEETNLKKYGVKNPSYSENIKKKISKKNKANAGTRMIQLKKNNQEKYGVDNVFQLDAVKEKAKESIIEKYGVENPSQSTKIKLKKEETCLNNYGVRNPQQNIDIFEKTNKHRWKDYTMPSGKIIKTQGYENLALDILLETYNEDDLILERKQIPTVMYGKNNKHQYLTDIFIPKENKFIEVKSPYTFNKYLEINLMKEQASIEAGYNFEFMILDGKGNIIKKEDLLS